MKATRLFLAALTLALVSACNSANITGPAAVDVEANQTEARSGGFGGSGN